MKTLEQIIERYRDNPDFFGRDLKVPNQRGADGDTLLHLVAWFSGVGDIEVLLEHGADVNLPGDMGYTPLHCAATAGKPENVRMLLRAGADPNVKNEFGHTPLQTAELGGHDDVVKLLKNAERVRLGTY